MCQLRKWHKPLDKPPKTCYTIGMNKTNNPYVNTLLEMGYDKQDTYLAPTKKTFPCVIYGKQFNTEEEYNEALHEFMNGM